MRKSSKKPNKRLIAALLCLCLMSLSLAAYAASGSITVKVEKEIFGFEVYMCPVAEADGTLLGDYAPLGLEKEQLTKESERRNSAFVLHEYTLAKGLPCTVLKTDEKGSVSFKSLGEGIYLIWEMGDELEFSPFLVSVPTIVGDSVTYNVIAEPKADDPPPTPGPTPTPTPPPVPTPPPNLPQTGTDMLPIWLLLGFGGLALVAGIVLVLPRKGKEREDA